MKKVISVFIVFFLLTGCTQINKLGFRSYSNNFTENLKNNTASMTLYRDFTTIAMAKATHFNKNLMKQYIEYTQRVDLKNDKNKKYQKMLDDFNKYDIYWVAFYTDDDDINNLASKDSFWNIYLVQKDKTLPPLQIKEVSSNNFKRQWLYLVNFSTWSQEYIIKFKKTKYAGKKNNLIISSFLGTINLKFER